MHTIVIQSWTGEKNPEWEHKIKASTGRGCRRRATNWLAKNVCESDYEEVEKRIATATREYWSLV